MRLPRLTRPARAQITNTQVKRLIDHKDSVYIRAIGFLYLRHCCEPKTLWTWCAGAALPHAVACAIVRAAWQPTFSPLLHPFTRARARSHAQRAQLSQAGAVH